MCCDLGMLSSFLVLVMVQGELSVLELDGFVASFT